MFKTKDEEPTIDGKLVKNIQAYRNHVECNAGKLKAYIGRNAVIIKGNTKLDALGLREVDWKVRCNPPDSESFEIDLSMSKRDFKGKMPRLIIGKEARVHDGNTYISVKIDENDVKVLKESGIEFDRKGFLNASGIKNAVGLVNTRKIQVGADTKNELETLMLFEKAITRAGAVVSDAVRLPSHPSIADKLAKQEELLKRNLG